MCESCNDQSYLWTTGCNECGVSSTTHTFDQLYSNYYNKLSGLSGNKFLPGSFFMCAKNCQKVLKVDNHWANTFFKNNYLPL